MARPATTCWSPAVLRMRESSRCASDLAGLTDDEVSDTSPDSDDVEQFGAERPSVFERAIDCFEPARTVLFVCIVVWIAWFFRLPLVRHERFQTFGFDLGIYDQGVWLLSQFRDPFVTVRGLDLFGHHMNPFLLVLAPFYRCGRWRRVPARGASARTSERRDRDLLARARSVAFALVRCRARDRTAAEPDVPMVDVGVLPSRRSRDRPVALRVLGCARTTMGLVHRCRGDRARAARKTSRSRSSCSGLLVAFRLRRRSAAARVRARVDARRLPRTGRDPIERGLEVPARRRRSCSSACTSCSTGATTGASAPRSRCSPVRGSCSRRRSSSRTSTVSAGSTTLSSDPSSARRRARSRRTSRSTRRSRIERITESSRQTWYWRMLAPFALLPLVYLRAFAIALPMVAVNVLTLFPYTRDYRFHYSALVVAGGAVASVEAIAWMQRVSGGSVTVRNAGVAHRGDRRARHDGRVGRVAARPRLRTHLAAARRHPPTDPGVRDRSGAEGRGGERGRTTSSRTSRTARRCTNSRFRGATSTGACTVRTSTIRPACSG